jgi:hypothetical protein
MHLLHLARTDALGHGLDTLAVARPEQAGEIHGRPAPLRFAIKRLQERREPGLKVFLPRRGRFLLFLHYSSAHFNYSTANVSVFLHRSVVSVAE